MVEGEGWRVEGGGWRVGRVKGGWRRGGGVEGRRGGRGDWRGRVAGDSTFVSASITPERSRYFRNSSFFDSPDILTPLPV